MKIIKVDTSGELANVCADLIENQIQTKPDSKICFATGSSPIETYKKLIQKYKQGLNFENIITFNLDEYVGLDKTHPCSYYYFMQHNLFSHINVKPDNINFPNNKGDLIINANDYENLIKKHGGIDLTILGIGTNGHIAFNEPGSLITDRTREVKLTESTIKSNNIYFKNPNDIPLTALSMGIATILQSKKIILIAFGKSKANAIKNMIEGPITSECPASFLQTHPNVTIIVDKDAASLLLK
ncbi:glucosamine-6-phosphate deaminase [Mycoplasmopsis cricetuli]|uniref:glucosamine-6-phosphate deaminase n=1 Tax=Mycoplasmopsis cricetuli TaxID=171283 RepID=UPI0004711180|nr:glucosamine-6-phosphate deaminase [Mycoplasmopsis cricetuli]